MNRVIVSLLTLFVLGTLAFGWHARHSRQPRAALRTMILGLIGMNSLGILLGAAAIALSLIQPMPVFAQEPGATSALSGGTIGAGLATGLACTGAGIGVGMAGAAAIGAITEKPETLGRTLIFVGLGEGIAIYGLIISFMILSK